MFVHDLHAFPNDNAVVSICDCACLGVCTAYPPPADTSRQMTLREVGILQHMVSALKGPIAESEVKSGATSPRNTEPEGQ